MITLAIKGIIIAAFIASISDILYGIEQRLGELLQFLEKTFEIFAGVKPVMFSKTAKKYVYDAATGGMKIVSGGLEGAKETTLLEIVFGNSTINKIYWGMALIGCVMCFGFAIFAIMKKMFDHEEKMKTTMGNIIGGTLKGIILILSLNLIVNVALTASQTLLNQFVYVFDNAGNADAVYTIKYSEEDYAAMARCINTIANYGLNKSYNSRFNLNSCFNAIRKDLLYLEEGGKFDYPYRLEYTTTDPKSGEQVTKLSGEDTWQSILYDIAAADTTTDVYLDANNETIADSISYAMEVIKTDQNLQPLDHYTITLVADDSVAMAPVDRICMLLGTMGAAYKGRYNQNMGFTDSLRQAYYYGWKDIYTHAVFDKDFNYFIFKYKHLLCIYVLFLFIKHYMGMCFNAAARVFNMTFLYLIAPPFLAVTPLDDGGKTKQWTTAFLIQTFSLFGTVLAMRLFTIIVPIVVNSNVTFFSSSKLNMYAQVIFILATAFVVQKANNMVTGILADNAGMEAIHSGDLESEAGELVSGVKDKILGAASWLGGQAMGVVGDVQGVMNQGGGGGSEGEGGDGDGEDTGEQDAELPENANNGDNDNNDE